MYDACHISLRKLYGTYKFELTSHGHNVEWLGTEDDRFLFAVQSAQVSEYEVR